MKVYRFLFPVSVIIFSVSFIYSCSTDSSSAEQSALIMVDHGSLHVDSNSRYFVFEDGTPYIPIGLNNFLLFRKNEKAMDSILNLYSEHGINYVRIWAGLGADPETEVGKFDEDQMSSLDQIVQSCKKHGIYLNISFWNENCIQPQKGNWGWNGSQQIYNKDNSKSGTTTNADDLKDTLHGPSWNAMKNRYATFVERWKNEPAVIMWDLVNDCKKSEAWKTGMYNYVRKIDGSDRIITFQYNTGVDPKGEMDCGSVRIYHYNPEGNDPEEMMLSLADRIRQALTHGDPVYCGEGGMDHVNGSEYALERGFLHFLWAPIAVGAAGNLHSWLSGDTWPDPSDKELDWINCYSDFCKTINWSGFNSRNVNEEIVPEQPNIKAFACRSDNEVLFYLMNDDPADIFKLTQTGLKISTPLEKGKYQIRWIDIRNGKTIGSKKISRFPITIKTPGFKDGLFGHIRKIDAR
jgi:hypothetical protein